MTREQISIVGYDIVASAQCDYGVVLVLNNNSTHYLVVETESGGEDLDQQGKHTVLYNPTATVVETFDYVGWKSAQAAYGAALSSMAGHAISRSDGLDEACHGCGCRPGDGLTESCSGCGYFREVE